MEDSDNLILISLKQIGCKFQSDSINKLGSDEIIAIVLQLLKFLGTDITPFKIIDQSQKYRVANKIRDELKKAFSVQVDFMVFINPNPSDVRKLFVSLISRMSAMESTKPEEQTLTYEEKLETERNRKKAELLKDWKNDEWILPELQNFTSKRRRFLDLDLKDQNLRNNLLLSSISNLNFSSLVTSSVSHLHNLERTQLTTEQERENRTGRNNDTRANTAARLKAIAQKNKDAWTVNYKKTANAENFESKLDELVKETEATTEAKEEAPVDQGPSLYGLELQFKQKEDQNAKKEEEAQEQGKAEPEFDIEKIRMKHKAELDKISELLSEKQQTVVNMEEKINKLDAKKQKLEDELREIKDQNVEVEKKTGGLHELLQLIENPDKSERELKAACEQLEKDIQEMNEEWNKHKVKVVSKIEKYKVTIEENKEKLEEIKSKIKFLETDYDALIQKIKTNQDIRIYLQNEYTNLPKEVSRNVFVKRINEINTSYMKQKNDLNNILSEVEEVEKKMDYNTSLIERHCTEIENTLRANPKPDNLTKSILKMYQDYQSIFQNTIKNLKEHGSGKLEARDLERKIENFQSKGYANLIVKLQSDVDTVKYENEKLMVDYQKRAAKMQNH
jgi:hypothetical protein